MTDPTGQQPVEALAEAAWVAHRDQFRSQWWLANDPKRAARQMRKRDFLAGYHAAFEQATARDAAMRAEGAREALVEAAADDEWVGHGLVQRSDVSGWLRDRAARLAPKPEEGTDG